MAAFAPAAHSHWSGLVAASRPVASSSYAGDTLYTPAHPLAFHGAHGGGAVPAQVPSSKKSWRNALHAQINPRWGEHSQGLKDNNAWRSAQRSQLDNDDTRWFVMLLKIFWPKVIDFLAAQLTEMVENIHAKIDQKVNSEFYVEVQRFKARLSAHEVSMPLETSWINEVLKDLWSLVVPIFSQAVKFILVPMVNQKVGGMAEVKVEPCTLGATAPKITKLISRRKESCLRRRGEGTNIVMELQWDGDLNINVQAGPVDFGLKGVKLCVELQVALVELLKRPPFVGGIGVWMDKTPEFELDFTGSLDILDLFNGLIHNQVKNILSALMILPNRIAIPLTDGLHNQVDIFRIKHPWPRGLLKFSNIRVQGLTLGRSHNPFVEVTLGCCTSRTTVLRGVHGHAEWDDSLYFLVDEPLEQCFYFSISDSGHLGESPLAESHTSLSLLALLSPSGSPDGYAKAEPRELSGECHRSTEMKLDVLWNNMSVEEHEKRLTAIEEDVVHRGKQRSRRNGLFANFRHRLSHLEVEHMKTVDTRLSFELTWRPLAQNSFVAKSIDPKINAACGEPVAAVLFVGVGVCKHLPVEEKQADKTEFWVQVRCTPSIDSLGQKFQDTDPQDSSCQRSNSVPLEEAESPKQNNNGAFASMVGVQARPAVQMVVRQATAKLANDALQCTFLRKTRRLHKQKGKKNLEKLAEDEDKQEELVQKICLLVKHNVPYNVIADTLGITPAKVQSFILNAALGSLTEHCNITFNNGFCFLLDCPKTAQIHAEVFRQVKGSKAESLGISSFHVGSLLGSPLLSKFLEDVSLIGSHPDIKLSMKVELRTVCMGDSYPLGKPETSLGGGQPSSGDGRRTVATEPLVFVPGARQPSRVVFFDRVGRQKAQVDGIWEDSDVEQ